MKWYFSYICDGTEQRHRHFVGFLYSDPRVSSVSQACRERRLNGAISKNRRIKRLAPCRFFDGHVKEPCEMSYVVGSQIVGPTSSVRPHP